MLSRRGLITGLISLAAAPAIVRASSLMPIKVMEPTLTAEQLFRMRMEAAYEVTRKSLAQSLYGELTDITRQAFVPRLFVQVYARSPLLGLEVMIDGR